MRNISTIKKDIFYHVYKYCLIIYKFIIYYTHYYRIIRLEKLSHAYYFAIYSSNFGETEKKQERFIKRIYKFSLEVD